MKILMLSSFPPTKCGIGAYAEQQARNLEAEGHEVKRFDVHQLNEVNWTRPLFWEFEDDVKRADKVIVQYQASLLRSAGGLPLVKSLRPYGRLTKVLREARAEVEIVIHEFFTALTPIAVGLQESYAQRLFDSADIVSFHTKIEAEQFDFAVRGIKRVVPPESHYQKYTGISEKEARYRLLGADSLDKRIFITAGFYHPGKGYERLVKSFFGLSDENQLYIITSDRQGVFAQQLAALRKLARPKNIHIIIRYVSDEEFDMWIQASDFVVVPYTYGFTSSLIARASLYGKPCIASSLTAIREQAVDKDVRLFATDEELGSVLREVAV